MRAPSRRVSPAAFIWAHAQDEKDRRFHREAAEAGAWIEFDGISSDTVDQNIGLIQEAKMPWDFTWDRGEVEVESLKTKSAHSQLTTHGAQSLWRTEEFR